VHSTEVDLTGMIDLHIHTAPDTTPRRADDIETARAAMEAGMAAILIKSHDTLTADRATIAEKVVGGVRVLGGLALNEAVGGLNPVAVQFALSMGARQIWMPTRSAAHDLQLSGKPGGISILTGEGQIRPEVWAILELIRSADAILGTGHLALDEVTALVRAAPHVGVRKILITHPEADVAWMPLEAQQEIAGGDVFFERCYLQAAPGLHPTTSIAVIAQNIRSIGVESTVLSTDMGQATSPPPTEGLRAYLTQLATEGFSRAQIELMASQNAACLLKL